MRLFSIAKRSSIAAALATVAMVTVTVALVNAPSAAYAADVGVSIRVGEPGFYGQIDIGDYPQPRLVYAQPVVIERRDEYGPPLYLRVPPGHIKHWRDHCREYKACGQRVYFVQDSWYNREYAPRYKQRHQDHYEDRRHDHDGDRHDDQHRGDDDRDGRNDRHDNDRGH